MLKIRLKRQGRKRLPFYRLVIMENLSKRDGRAIEELGFYDPITKKVKLNISRIVYRLNTGAQPTDTVRNLLIKSKILEKI
jgi:small subunit ribosomal protein S16|tara:strand:+ start:13534 stop:13776 length:243 start_codon:yes stop_codon:yes gene_type:complete